MTYYSGRDIEAGLVKKKIQRDTAADILNYIRYVCFDKSEEMRDFRWNYGSNGERDAVIQYIKLMYLADVDD